jgi:DinB superfamily
MKKARLLVAVLLVTCASLGFAQMAATPEAKSQPTVSSVLDRSLSGVEKEFVDLADAMPEAKYDFFPTSGNFKGVRNFGEQVKHVAGTNYFFAATILGEKPPTENGASLKTKAEIMKYLRDSFAYAHKAVASINEKNMVEEIKFGRGTGTRLGISTMMVGHTFDHYGQLVEYVRMNGIIPPASRK